MSRTKIMALVMTVLTLIYVALLGQRGLLLLGQDQIVAKIMGGFILVLPVIAVWGIFVELRFGLRVEKLATSIEASGDWPDLELEFRPSGRPTKETATKAFHKIQAETEAAPESWLNWFSLSLAYDACGDRRRARAAMRKALELSQN